MSWALDVDETTPNEADASRWQPHAIYRVPAYIKDVNPKAYRPQVVSLGPFHHGDAALLPMEEHKRRALAHLLRRCGRPLEEFRAAVRSVAEHLESAYRDPGAEWRGDDGGTERFLDMLLVDGCFLLEAMRVAEEVGAGRAGDYSGYATSDPVFSRHGVLYVMPFVRRDMLMLENQLPLLLLEKLVAVQTGEPPSAEVINSLVLGFISWSPWLPSGSILGLHPLHVRRRSMIYGPKLPREVFSGDILPETIRSAVELYEAGIRFRKTEPDSLHSIRFRGGVLRMPAVSVDDSTESALLNMMAFERLHAGAGSDVAAYVFFMSSVLGSARDVALLRSEGILQNAAAGSDAAVAQMFERMSKDAVVDPEEASAIGALLLEVDAYCRRRRMPWRKMCGTGHAGGSRTTTWAILAVVLLVMLLVQTIYTALQFYMLRRR